MRPQVARLKTAAIQACRLKSFPFREFMEDWGLEDILIQADKDNTPPPELAARVLAECCITDGKFNNFQVGLLTILMFLNDTFGPLPQGQEQSLRDLVAILNSGGRYDVILQWMQSYYR